MFKPTLLILMIVLSSVFGFAQDVKKHIGKQRVIVIYSESADHPLFNEQVSELNTNPQGLDERKLIVYSAIGNKIYEGFETNGNFRPMSDFSTDYQPRNKTFEIQLIGLDGGLKLRQSQILSLKTLFETIDQMPMRRAEIRRSKNNR